MAVTTMLQKHEVFDAVLHVVRLVLLLGFFFLAYKIFNLVVFTYRVRHRYHEIPHVPRHWLWGNVVSVGEKLNPAINQHPDYVFEDIWNELGQPPAYFIDLAPIDRAMLIISDPSLAEICTQASADYKYSMPKSNTLQALTKLVGDHSLVLIEGDEWRTQRRRFNKGFAPAHLNSLVPLVVSKTKIFLDRLKQHAENGSPFSLRDVASDLTTDVITQVAIDKDFHAQTVPTGQGSKSRFGVLTAITTMSSLTEKVGQGFDLGAYIYPQRKIKAWLFDRIYTKSIYDEIMRKLPSIKNETEKESTTSTVSSAKAIVNLALTGLDPTPSVLNSTISQVKTFLFAGQDTTSTLIQWMAYEMSKSYPSSPRYTEHYRQIRERLCTEHDEVLGTHDPFAILDMLEDPSVNVDELLGAKLPYTTAFVKETLRLHPPGGSARLIPLAPFDPDYPSNKDSKPYFMDLPAWTNSKSGERHEGQRVQADGLRFYVNHWLIQRNPKIWGPDTDVFEPARFLDRSGKGSVDELEEAMSTTNIEAKSSTKEAKVDLPHPYHISTLPTGSYRPFERGPRTCIGSNLAYIEAKIVLAVIARGFEWQKIGLDGRRPNPGKVDYLGTGKEDVNVGEARGWEVWNINNVTAVPVDGMKMGIKLRQ